MSRLIAAFRSRWGASNALLRHGDRNRQDAVPLQLPISLKETAARLARDDGAEEFLNRRAAAARPGGLARYLDGAPDAPPAQDDELPDG